jgi:hypothetical protein
VPALVGFLFFLLCAGCASVPPSTQSEQAQGDAPHADVIAAPSSDGKATPSTTTGSTGKIATKAAPSGAKTPANSPLPASQPPKKDSTASELTKQKTSPPLDLTSLEKRLKETHAIDVVDKIAFRNQVDDLLSQFRAFYQGTLKTSLTELRRPYDLLVFELLSLLQDRPTAGGGGCLAGSDLGHPRGSHKVRNAFARSTTSSEPTFPRRLNHAR